MGAGWELLGGSGGAGWELATGLRKDHEGRRESEGAGSWELATGLYGVHFFVHKKGLIAGGCVTAGRSAQP